MIKELQPAYYEVPRIVATNYRYSVFRYLLRSQSVPDIVTTLDHGRRDNLNLQPEDSGTVPRTAPDSCPERTKQRQSTPAGPSLSLAQRVYLARRVELYIASHQLQVISRILFKSNKYERDCMRTAVTRLADDPRCARPSPVFIDTFCAFAAYSHYPKKVCEFCV